MRCNELLEKEWVDSHELESLLEARKSGECTFLLVDVREPYEYEEMHIVGVDLLRPTSRFREWAQELADLSRETPLVLTCRTANRTGQVQQLLKRMGGERVVDHRSGIMTWHGEVEGGPYGGN